MANTRFKAENGFYVSSGNSQFDTTSQFNANVNIAAGLTVLNAVSFANTLNVTGAVAFANTLNVIGDVVISGSLSAGTVVGYAGSQGVRGYTGSLGYTGSQGAGYTGSQGVTGFTGSQGVTGFTGSQGVIGFTGSQGSQGSQGTVGYTGSQGVQGVPGAGFTGSQGAIGFTGSQGTVGYTGSQGSQGSPGGLGYTGSQGVIGYTGSQGSQGTVGYAGSQGVQGVPGTGFTGSQGVIGFTGSQGVIGYTGSQGVQGVPGAGFTGSQGVIGYTGSQGAVGYTGSQGQGIVGETLSIGTIGTTNGFATNTSAIRIGNSTSNTSVSGAGDIVLRSTDGVSNGSISITTSPTTAYMELGANDAIIDFKYPNTKNYDARLRSNTSGFYIIARSSGTGYANDITLDAETVTISGNLNVTGTVNAVYIAQYDDPDDRIIFDGVTTAGGKGNGSVWYTTSSHTPAVPSNVQTLEVMINAEIDVEQVREGTSYYDQGIGGTYVRFRVLDGSSANAYVSGYMQVTGAGQSFSFLTSFTDTPPNPPYTLQWLQLKTTSNPYANVGTISISNAATLNATYGPNTNYIVIGTGTTLEKVSTGMEIKVSISSGVNSDWYGVNANPGGTVLFLDSPYIQNSVSNRVFWVRDPNEKLKMTQNRAVFTYTGYK